ncbi:transcription antiterminator BglG [Clostridium sp. C8]|nr:transcription antiterminator BglG [Clostridium sp. C8]
MMNNRQTNIVRILGEQKEWITGKELSRLLNVSDRTIRSDIDNINKYYQSGLIKSNQRQGYHIDESLLNGLNIEVKYSIPQTPSERCVFMIRQLLFEKNEINLTILQSQIYVSGYSIENDLKRIRKMLEPYPKLRLIRSKNYIYLHGDERSKRTLYKDLLAAETKGNFLNINRIASLYKNFDLLLVKDILLEVFDEYKFSVKDIMFPMLVIHIGISIERIMKYNFIKTDRKDKEFYESREYKISKEFFKRVSDKINIKLVEDEIQLMTLLLMGKNSLNYSTNLLNLDKKKLDIEQLVINLLGEIREFFGTDFMDDTDLIVGLKMHIQGMVSRAKNAISIDNVFLQDIKRKYPLVFEMGIYACHMIEDSLGFSVNENEAGFIALHLGAANERMNKNSKYKVIIISPHNQSFSSLCKQKIDDNFGERLDIIKILNYFEEGEVISYQPDLILTLSSLQHSLDIMTIQISMFISSEDEMNIYQAIKKLDKKKFQIEFNSKISNIIKKEFFYTNFDGKSEKDIINKMCNKLEDHKIVPIDFKESVLKREEMSPTSFFYGFATPHDLRSQSYLSTISVALLKSPVKWGVYEVKLVMLLAINEEDKSLLFMFLEWLASTISDELTFSELLEVKDYEEFLERIMG